MDNTIKKEQSPVILIDPRKCREVPAKPRHVQVINPDIFERKGFLKFPAIRGCLPAVLHQGEKQQVLAIHTTVKYASQSSSTVEEVVSAIKEHIERYDPDGYWQLAVAVRASLDTSSQDWLDKLPHREELLTLFRDIQQTFPRVTPKITQVLTNKKTDDLYFSPEIGFVRTN